MLRIALLSIGMGHPDHLHAGAKVTAGGHIFVDVHSAPLFG